MCLLSATLLVSCGKTKETISQSPIPEITVSIKTTNVTPVQNKVVHGEDESEEFPVVVGIGNKPGTHAEPISPTETLTPEVTATPTVTPIPTVTPAQLTADGSISKADAIVEIEGIKLSIGADFKDNINKFSEKAEIVEGQACLSGGYDTNYYYSTFSVYTVADNNKQIIYDILVKRSGYTTAKGAIIGKSTRDQVKTIYGEATKSFGASDKYEVGNNLVISFEYENNILVGFDIANTDV